jgi:hypothetical protein
MDGYAYIAFSQNEWTLEIAKCAAGSTLDPNQVNLVRAENVMLWQIHPDGTYRSTTVESVRNEQSASAPVNVASPTGALVGQPQRSHDSNSAVARLAFTR